MDEDVDDMREALQSHGERARHAVVAAEVEILADDVFEELAAAQGTGEDLRQADLGLPGRETPVITGEAMGVPRRSRRKRANGLPVCRAGMYPFRYPRSSDSTVSVTCWSRSSCTVGMGATPSSGAETRPNLAIQDNMT